MCVSRVQARGQAPGWEVYDIVYLHVEEFDHITSLLSAGLLERQLSRMENNGQRLSFKLSLYGVISLLN